MIWTWGAGFWDWPSEVWISVSDDGGKTFSPSRKIAETWGMASAASHEGVYYVLYRSGTEYDQEWVMALSRDGGVTWKNTSVSGPLAVASDWTKAPGIDVSPTGTIDVVFYAQDQDSTDCMSRVDNWRLGERWVDRCVYNVHYAYSQDGGRSFSEAVGLNEMPVKGERFVRFEGYSLAHFRLGIASLTAYAQPTWIETQGERGTQVYTVRVER